MKDLLIRAQELMGPSKNRKEGIQMVAKGLKVSEKEATKLVDAVIKMNEEADLDEAISKSEYYYVDPKGVVVAVGSKDAMRKMKHETSKRWE